MAILYTTACALSLFVPQGPGSGPAFEMADLLPRDSLIAVGVNACAPHEQAIRETGLVKILERVMAESDVGSQLQMVQMQLKMMSGLSVDQLKAALSNGMAFSWTGLDDNDKPDWVAVVNVGDHSQAIGKMIERLIEMAESQASVRSDLWEDTLVHTMRTDDGLSLAVALHHELLVVGSGKPEVEGVLTRRDRHGEPSLVEHPEFRAISRSLSENGQPLMGVFVQPAELSELLVRSVPPDVRGPVRDTVQALRVNRVPAAGYAVHARDGEFHDYVRIVFPEPRQGLLSTLLTGTGEVDRGMSALIPPDVTGYSLISMSVPQILEDILETAGQVDPMAASVADGLLANLKQRSQVDLREELLPTVGNQILTLQWEGGEMFGQDMAVLINLHDSLQFENAWNSLLPLMPIPIKAREVKGHKVYQYPVPDLEETQWPIMTVAGEHLVIASGQEPFRKVLSQIEAPRVNSDAQERIAGLPPGTFMASWVDLGRSLGPQLGAVSEMGGFDSHGPAWQALLQAVDELAGAMRTTATKDAEGVEFRAHSPIGNAQGLAMVSIGAAIALPSLIAARDHADFGTLATPQWDSGMTGLMQDVASAQAEFKASRGEYGTFADLIDMGLLAPESLGEALDNGFFRRDGHLIALFVPTSDVDRAHHYVAVAWPDEERIGVVYGSIPQRPAIANDLIAAASGIRRIDPRDIYVGGDFTAGLVAGWRDLATEPRDGTGTMSTGAVGRTNEDLHLLYQAEENGDQEELARLLSSQNPEVAARAAHVLGQLNAREAVPELCEAVTHRAELNVRLHAMKALTRIRDPRSHRASTHALESESVMLRALGAANLGKLRDPDSVQPLLNMIGRPGHDDEDARDQVQALLALNDIGLPECLLPAAAAGTSETEEVEQALTYLFQNLSPKLPPEEEVTSLMAVLDHRSPLLRRYAIQRLGELKDETAVRTLEGRLAAESEESLRPLIQVALDSIRGTESATPATDVLSKVRTEADKLWGRAKGRWATLSDQERLMLKAGAGGFVLLIGLLLVWRSRRRRAVRGEAMARMVAPSEGLAPTHEEQYEEEGDEYTPTADGGGEYFEEVYDEPVHAEAGTEDQTDDDWLPEEESKG